GQGVAPEILGRQQAREDDDGQKPDHALHDVGRQIAEHPPPEHQRTAIRSPNNTGTVTAMIHRSSQKDWRSMYSISSCTRRRTSSAVCKGPREPLMAAQPVIPGLMRWR